MTPHNTTQRTKDASETPRNGPLEQPGDLELARLARGLAHPLRVAILRRLCRGGACVCGDLVEMIPRAQSTVSQHLKILKESGLIQGQIDGPRVCYCADPQAIVRLRQLMMELVP